MHSTPRVRPALEADWPRIQGLLWADKLPTSDLSEASARDFLVADGAGAVVGTVAVERHGDHGLLRSLVVDRACRQSGVGRALVRAAETIARRDGLASLTLLTQTAAPFFRSLGYRDIARPDAPATVQSSHEFTHLCPGSSICMTKAMTTRTV
ncbi:MAG: acetyltransferase family protein [Burkholderiaceae bacterium]|nr:acetyltransferase family protein [Burkholderiaceae bacterium]